MSETDYKNYLLKQQQMEQEEPMEEDNLLQENADIETK
jgi:hypothetical protein